MGSKVTVEMSMSSPDQVYINPRVPIVSIEEKNLIIEHGEEFASSNSVQDLFTSIVEDGTPSFQFKWKPESKYKSVFPNLKAGRVRPNIYFTFVKKDGDGTLLWIHTFEVVKAKVKDAVGSGTGSGAAQKVKVECEMLIKR